MTTDLTPRRAAILVARSAFTGVATGEVEAINAGGALLWWHLRNAQG